MLTVVIQAGGESRRMGTDKALRPFLGQPLIARVLQRVQAGLPQAQEFLITTNRPENYGFLHLPLVPDRLPGRGALGGLYTALSAAHQPLVAVVACDMPFVNPVLLQTELDWLQRPQPDAAPLEAVLPRHASGTEPFHAVYRQERCLPKIEAALQAEKWRVDAWFQESRIHFIDPEAVQPFDPHGLAFWNLNTPEEFEEAEALARQHPDW